MGCICMWPMWLMWRVLKCWPPPFFQTTSANIPSDKFSLVARARVRPLASGGRKRARENIKRRAGRTSSSSAIPINVHQLARFRPDEQVALELCNRLPSRRWWWPFMRQSNPPRCDSHGPRGGAPRTTGERTVAGLGNNNNNNYNNRIIMRTATRPTGSDRDKWSRCSLRAVTSSAYAHN